MPIPQTIRIDSRDLDKNKAIGISIPFNGRGVFNSTYDTKSQIKSNLINLLLTLKGERIENPEFGTNILRLLFEPIEENLYESIQNEINISINKFIPEIILDNINIITNEDNNSISVQINYRLKLSLTPDNITIELQ